MLKMKETCYTLISLPRPPSYRPHQRKLDRRITCTLKEFLCIVLRNLGFVLRKNWSQRYASSKLYISFNRTDPYEKNPHFIVAVCLGFSFSMCYSILSSK